MTNSFAAWSKAPKVTPVVKLGGSLSSLILPFQRAGSQDVRKFPEFYLTRRLVSFLKALYAYRRNSGKIYNYKFARESPLRAEG